MNQRNEYPEGLKPGDFIQTSNHFSDVFFEVTHCYPPEIGGPYWRITYVRYEKYGAEPIEEFVNSATSISAVIKAELAIPVMLIKRLRFYAIFGHYDPIFGFAPKGTALRSA